MPLIEPVHAESGGTYGARRITRALGRRGHGVARCTVERLMTELGLEDVIRGRRRRTTVPEPSAPRPPDLVDRDFTGSRPDQLWVADMTCVRRVRTGLLAKPGTSPTVRLKQDHRTLRNSGQLTACRAGAAVPVCKFVDWSLWRSTN
jgi:hypothetical protein